MDVKKVSGLVAALGVIVGAVVTILNFFQTKAEAAEQTQKLRTEQAAAVADVLETQKRDRTVAALENANTRLSFLSAKQKPTADDFNEMDFLRDQIKRLRAELAR